MPPTLIEILNKTADHLKKKGVENHRLDAQLLLGMVLKLDRVALYLNYDRPLSQTELEACRDVVKRRASREPLQHILGEVKFREITLKVDKRALVPRKETELIIDAVKEAAKSLPQNKDTLSILDIGVGTGAIFLSLKKEFPKADIYGVELSGDALSLAKENAIGNKLEFEDSLKQGDTFQPFPVDRKWDIIVSNPPYVAKRDLEELQPEVKLWDPQEALIGGEEGTEYPMRLISESFSHTTQPGFLIMEIGDGQGAILRAEAERCSWAQVTLKQDFSEKERFLVLKR
jgi:release factor glutamine methyltransferase